MLCYCKKCGRIAQEDYGKNEQKCDYCNSVMQYVPEQFLIGKRGIAINDNLKDQFINEYIKPSPEFDQYLFDHRDEILAKQSAKYERAMTHGKAVLEGKDKGNPYGVSCPNCKATNVRKITITNKAVHTSIFGFWSIGRNSKSYHCDRCGSDF